ncbi:MAG: hypothetical protein IPM48_14840 [Saprospiraceae bacterium]|nr:hypothetical protein [Saprospiraceae bacterium]
MAKIDIFGDMPNIKKLEIYEYAKQNSVFSAASKYHKEVGISENGLYRRLRRDLKKANQLRNETFQRKSGAGKAKEKDEVKLSREEKKFLKNLKNGKASLEEASRFVAVRAFEKMLKNPGDVKFLDFFRVELLKIKKMEAETKKTWAIQLVNRLWGGAELPPPVCPYCDKELIPNGRNIMDGEIIYDVESLPATNNS